MSNCDSLNTIKSRLPAMVNRDFRLYWFGQSISLIGTWIQNIGIVWLTLQLTGSPFRVGLVSALQFVPTVLLGLIVGAIVDKYSKRITLLLSIIFFSILGILTGGLQVLGHMDYKTLLVIALTIGILNSIYNTSRQAFLIELTGKQDLGNAIALSSTAYNLSKIIGPAIAGFLIFKFGLAVCFYLNGISYFPLILFLILFQYKKESESIIKSKSNINKLRTIFTDICDGITYIKNHGKIFLMLMLLFLMSVFVINYSVQIPILSQEISESGSVGYGLLMSSIGVGAFVGAFMLTVMRNKNIEINYLLKAGFFMSLFTIFLGFQRIYWLSCIFLFIIGLCSIILTVSINTFIQTASERQMLGRVTSVYTIVYVGANPLGNIFAGLISEKFGILVCFILSGILGIAITLCVKLLLKRVGGVNE